MLKCVDCQYYKVKEGQSVAQIANYFCISPWVLAQKNGLTSEPYVGQILVIPSLKGNAYVVREGDCKALLCGSDERFEKLNGTTAFYVGMHVRI